MLGDDYKYKNDCDTQFCALCLALESKILSWFSSTVVIECIIFMALPTILKDSHNSLFLLHLVE